MNPHPPGPGYRTQRSPDPGESVGEDEQPLADRSRRISQRYAYVIFSIIISIILGIVLPCLVDPTEEAREQPDSWQPTCEGAEQADRVGGHLARPVDAVPG